MDSFDTLFVWSMTDQYFRFVLLVVSQNKVTSVEINIKWDKIFFFLFSNWSPYYELIILITYIKYCLRWSYLVIKRLLDLYSILLSVSINGSLVLIYSRIHWRKFICVYFNTFKLFQRSLLECSIAEVSFINVQRNKYLPI